MATVASDVARVLVHASRDATRRAQVDYMLRRRQVLLYVPATAASGTLSESSIFIADKDCVGKKLVMCPLGAVAGHGTDYATITVSSAGGELVYSTNTAVDDTLTATAHDVGQDGTATAAAGGITATITKNGGGVATPVIAVYFDYEES